MTDGCCKSGVALLRPCCGSVQTLLAMLPTLDVWWRRFHQYFGVLQAFAASGDQQRAYLLNRNLAAQLIDFVLQDSSPHPELNQVIEGSRPTTSRPSAVQPMIVCGRGRGVSLAQWYLCPRGYRRSLVALAVACVRSVAAAQGPLAPGAVFSDVADNDVVGIPGTVRIRRIMGDNWTAPNFVSFFALLKHLLLSSLPISGADTSPYQQEPRAAMSTITVEMVACPGFAQHVLSQLTSGAWECSSCG